MDAAAIAVICFLLAFFLIIAMVNNKVAIAKQKTNAKILAEANAAAMKKMLDERDAKKGQKES